MSDKQKFPYVRSLGFSVKERPLSASQKNHKNYLFLVDYAFLIQFKFGSTALEFEVKELENIKEKVHRS